MYNALGFCTLKSQKDHYDAFVLGKVPSFTVTPPALVHGMEHEVILFIFIIFIPSMNLIKLH